MKMENVLINLKSSINAKNDQEIVKNLQAILDQANDIKITEVHTFKKLLNVEFETVQIVGAEVIAELAKNQQNRNLFTHRDIVNRLMHFMNTGSNELIFTTIRALGNICYENEEGCNLVDKVGIDCILTVLKNDSDREDNSLTTKVSGLLVNLLNTHENLLKMALKGGILQTMEKLVSKYKDPIEENQVLQTFLLSILNSLTDFLDDKEYVFSEGLAKDVIEIVKKSEVPEIRVLCLEIFHALSEKDEIKTILATEGVCELLYELIEKFRIVLHKAGIPLWHTIIYRKIRFKPIICALSNIVTIELLKQYESKFVCKSENIAVLQSMIIDKINDEDSRSVLKMACDLIVLILTGDDCMELLYNDAQGRSYLNMLNWLDSSDPDLLSTGILAIGNFARQDAPCIQMVKNGVSKKLIDLLRKFNESSDKNDVKVQHALLSTLKNLVIPKENKAQVLNEHIIEVMYPMLKQDHFMVVFKLLGTFRMIIDGQASAALDLLSRKDFIERLVYWCYNSDHLGVRGEVPRIFSWLIKNAHCSKPFPTFISVDGSVKCIVEMISSNHAVMENEAFFALNILQLGLTNDQHPQEDVAKFYDSVCDATIGKNLRFVINKYGEKWDEHTTGNCLTLLEHLVKSEKVVGHFRDESVSEALEKLRGKGCDERVDEVVWVLSK